MANKILIIDDDTELIEALKLRLQEDQYEVITATSGQRGLERFDAERPDLIILDISMPKMDGYTFIKIFKGKYSISEVPILVLTGKSGMQETFALEGVRGYLTKPCDPEELIAKVKSSLSHAPSKSESQES